jgi:hypothetical protein
MRSRATLLATGALAALWAATFASAAFAEPYQLAFLSAYLGADFSCDNRGGGLTTDLN